MGGYKWLLMVITRTFLGMLLSRWLFERDSVACLSTAAVRTRTLKSTSAWYCQAGRATNFGKYFPQNWSPQHACTIATFMILDAWNSETRTIFVNFAAWNSIGWKNPLAPKRRNATRSSLAHQKLGDEARWPHQGHGLRHHVFQPRY